MSATGEGCSPSGTEFAVAGRGWRRYLRLLDDESWENHAEASTENSFGLISATGSYYVFHHFHDIC